MDQTITDDCNVTHKGPLGVENVGGEALYTCKACNKTLTWDEALKWVRNRKQAKRWW